MDSRYIMGIHTKQNVNHATVDLVPKMYLCTIQDFKIMTV